MSKKLGLALCYSLVFSIILLLAGFLGLAVRAFVSAGTENYILVATFAILAVTLTTYFTLRRPVAALAPKIYGPFRRMASERMDRRRALVHGQARAMVAVERRGKQRTVPLVVSHEPVVNDELRG